MYDFSKTLKKVSLPVILIIILRAAMAAAEAAGIKLDETEVMTIAAGGYAAIIGFINWIKNRKNSIAEVPKV